MAFSGEYMVPIEEAQKLERELAEARGVLVYEQGGIHATAGGWAAKYAEAVEQRNALAEALKSLCRAIMSEETLDITDLFKQSEAAIAAVEGGSHE
jgi:hypothetical protein